MSASESPRANRGAKLLGVVATALMVCGLALVVQTAPALADRNQCAPVGLDSATALPKDLTESSAVGQDDDHTTASVEPLSSVNIPLTHLVNYIDNRLRRGRAAVEPEQQADTLTSTFGQEMT
jgi:hypothetical protein